MSSTRNIFLLPQIVTIHRKSQRLSVNSNINTVRNFNYRRPLLFQAPIEQLHREKSIGESKGRAVGINRSSRISVLASHLCRSMSSEKEAALAAVPTDSPTIFDKIINKEIPSNVVYEDDKVFAFRDISPQAPTHILIIPKVKDGLTGLSKAEERHCEILGQLLYTAKLIAKQEGLEDGFRVVINDGPSGCQSVYHLHVHLIGGRQMNWPPG